VKIASGTVVTLTYDITTADGEIIESSDISGPVTFLHGQGAVLPGLDRKLEGMVEGDEGTFEFPPEQAFGTEDDAPTKPIPRNEFPKDMNVEVGLAFEAGMPNGQTIKLVVKEVNDDAAICAMVHPLAGKTISMAVKVTALRAATAAEKEAGKAIVRPPAPPPKK